ncbi:hypothetical protein VNO77_02675 [Canavalia gladiata]|uniref:Uncharacterized protein n=1 Tax=Canavalia gladiata TaxID=3824 RepID=A0AAN9R6B2_CANGL
MGEVSLTQGLDEIKSILLTQKGGRWRNLVSRLQGGVAFWNSILGGTYLQGDPRNLSCKVDLGSTLASVEGNIQRVSREIKREYVEYHPYVNLWLYVTLPTTGGSCSAKTNHGSLCSLKPIILVKELWDYPSMVVAYGTWVLLDA